MPYVRKDDKMKKILTIVCSIFLMFGLWGCMTQKDPFQEIEITAQELKEKSENGDNFLLIVERENCGYCEAIDEYIEQTSQEHPGITLYKLDITDFKFIRQEDSTLKADCDDSKILLDLVPYFLYTPTIYYFEDGQASSMASGFDASTNEVALWTLDSLIDFEQAEPQEFWTYLESNIK